MQLKSSCIYLLLLLFYFIFFIYFFFFFGGGGKVMKLENMGLKTLGQGVDCRGRVSAEKGVGKVRNMAFS